MSHMKREIEVAEGEYARVPGDTHHVLVGPGKLEVTRLEDGRAYGRIVEGEAKPRRFAIKRQLKLRTWGF